MPNSKNNNGKNIRKPAYVGINIEESRFCVAVKTNGDISVECVEAGRDIIDKKIFSWLYKYPLSHNVKIIGAGITSYGGDKEKSASASSVVKTMDGKKALADKEKKLATDIWLKEDIVPLFLKSREGSSEEKAREAVKEVANRFTDDILLDIKFDTKRKVVVEELARLEDFEKIVSQEESELLSKLAEKFKKQRGKLVFFSSTPHGGGVALMRHALIRFFRLLGINAQWYVMSSNEEIFEITKKKFHNVLVN